MNEQISSPEVKLLAALSEKLQPEYVEENNMWKGSPFEWIQTLPSHTKGSIGEKIVKSWIAVNNLDIVHTSNSDTDIIIHGNKVEIKYSNLWRNGCYAFQQLRDQDYDYCFCLGISPFDAHAWFIPKAELMVEQECLKPQHTGKQGSETKWLQFKADNPPAWLEPYGGSLEDVVKIIKSIRKK